MYIKQEAIAQFFHNKLDVLSSKQNDSFTSKYLRKKLLADLRFDLQNVLNPFSLKGSFTSYPAKFRDFNFAMKGTFKLALC